MIQPPPTDASRSSRVAAGCGVLFLIPFAVAGTVIGAQALRTAYAGNWRNAVLLGAGALTFGGVGFGGLAGLRVGYHRLKETEELKARNPEQPWLWRRDWASGRIEDSTRTNLLGAWVVAALWNLVAFPAGYLGLEAAFHEHKPAGFIVLLFPLAGLWLLARAVLASLRKQKYGISMLELSTKPGAIGRSLTGVVSAPVGLTPAKGFRVRLTSVRRVTSRTGKSSSTQETVLWEDEHQAPGQQSRDYQGMRTTIPIAFQLPGDGEPCDTRNANDRVLWRLQVEADVPGVDYEASFEVPVFRIASVDPSLASAAANPDSSSAVAAYRQPADSRISVHSTQTGIEILFPAARNPGAATGTSVFLCLWWGLVVAEVFLRAPLIFPILTGAFGLLLLVFALDLWLLVQRVSVSSEGITLTSGYLVPVTRRVLPAAEIESVATVIGMQVGTTPYYDIIARGQNGKKTILGRSLPDKREAEWLATTISNALES
jgi:hypothetical protein